MAFNNRKILDPVKPRKDLKSPIFVPCSYTLPQRDFSFLVSFSICVVGSILLFLILTVFLHPYVTKLRRRLDATVTPGDTNRRENDDEAEDSYFSGAAHHIWRINTVGLDRSVIDSITVVGFKKGDGIIDGTECSVCLNEFEEEESVRLLPKCNHAFHKNCIDTWLHSHKNCPLCRAPVFLTKPLRQETERNQQSTSESSIDLSVEEVEESSGSRNLSFLPRAQSDLARHCGSRSVKSVRRSFSIGGSSSIKACDGNDQGTTRSKRRFYTSLSANFFSSSGRPRNQEQVNTNQIP